MVLRMKKEGQILYDCGNVYFFKHVHAPVHITFIEFIQILFASYYKKFYLCRLKFDVRYLRWLFKGDSDNFCI